MYTFSSFKKMLTSSTHSNFYGKTFIYTIMYLYILMYVNIHVYHNLYENTNTYVCARKYDGFTFGPINCIEICFML